MPRRAAVVLLVAVATLGAAATAGATTLDVTRLPVVDAGTSSQPTVGKVLRCSTRQTTAAVAATSAPWIDPVLRTWSAAAKVTVRGTVRWRSQLRITTTAAGTTLAGNGLPSTPTGTFPVQPDDPAYRYQQSTGWIGDWLLQVTVPSPRLARSASCIDGIVGYSVLGVPIYAAVDGLGRDAVAREVRDTCDGRPSRAGRYYFRTLSSCFRTAAGADAGLFGYALDGYGIYADGQVATADLDACHGRTSVITWHGRKVSMYHYVATADFPYLVGCFRGTPVTLPPQGLGAVE